MGRAADLDILHDAHDGIGLGLPVVAGEGDSIPHLIAGPVNLFQRTAGGTDQDAVSVQKLPVVRSSLQNPAAAIHLRHILLGNAPDNKRLMLAVARNGADSGDLHAGQAVGRDIIHAGEGGKLLLQGFAQGVLPLHLHKFPAREVLVLQQILAPVPKLGLGHFLYIH